MLNSEHQKLQISYEGEMVQNDLLQIWLKASLLKEPGCRAMSSSEVSFLSTRRAKGRKLDPSSPAKSLYVFVLGQTSPVGKSFMIAVFRDWRRCSTLLTGSMFNSEKMSDKISFIYSRYLLVI